jgi:NhaP-type Na+/H+ or K+/H+ antiporter
MINFLGVIGTIIGFIFLCLFCSMIDALIFDRLDLKEIMLVSCVLCATDTVAAMSLIKVLSALFSLINFLS